MSHSLDKDDNTDAIQAGHTAQAVIAGMSVTRGEGVSYGKQSKYSFEARRNEDARLKCRRNNLVEEPADETNIIQDRHSL